MTTTMWVLGVTAYIIIGLFAARWVYAHVTDNPQTGGDPGPDSMLTFFLWPLIVAGIAVYGVWAAIVMRPTPKQRELAEAKRDRILREELERLAQDNDLPNPEVPR